MAWQAVEIQYIIPPGSDSSFKKVLARRCNRQAPALAWMCEAGKHIARALSVTQRVWRPRLAKRRGVHV